MKCIYCDAEGAHAGTRRCVSSAECDLRVTTKERDELQRQLDDTTRALHEKCESCSIGQGLEDRNKLLLEGVKSARAGFFAIQHNLLPSRSNGGNVDMVRVIVEEKIQILEGILAQVDGT